MSIWLSWLAAAGLLLILELFTGTFYLLMIAIGLAFGALAALLGASMSLQAIVAGAVGVLATGMLHRSRIARPRTNPARDRNVNLDIGQHITVPVWEQGKARVKYRGAMWDVELGQGAAPHPGDFKIVEIQGSRLIVSDS
ncbi:NfeD family protein [Massilia horti]|uniref:NfeD family protein n=1 Tax=Massilia horti TaxID=2562153 RepID=A0A4Y9T120_9BURK|nr:NfeD family protein [Massilia horti]TFW32962.1 NfeD family protein [Massilia horti]